MSSVQKLSVSVLFFIITAVHGSLKSLKIIDMASDYSYTSEVTSIRNSRKPYLTICNNVATPKVLKKFERKRIVPSPYIFDANIKIYFLKKRN